MKKAAFLLGTPNFFDPSYFDLALVDILHIWFLVIFQIPYLIAVRNGKN